MSLGRLASALVLGLAAGPSAAEIVCRPTTLGSLTCSGPAVRPEPRPAYVRNRGLDRVLPRRDPADGGTVFVPARRTNRLGTTTVDGPLPGSCRPDRLGNTYCR